MYYILNIYKHVHSVSDQQVKKIQTITILTDNKTKIRNIEKLRSLSFMYQYFCCQLFGYIPHRNFTLVMFWM